jgi:hypothetical protein
LVGKAKKINTHPYFKKRVRDDGTLQNKALHEKSHFINGPNKSLGFRAETSFVEIHMLEANNQ